MRWSEQDRPPNSNRHTESFLTADGTKRYQLATVTPERCTVCRSQLRWSTTVLPVHQLISSFENAMHETEKLYLSTNNRGARLNGYRSEFGRPGCGFWS